MNIEDKEVEKVFEEQYKSLIENPDIKEALNNVTSFDEALEKVSKVLPNLNIEEAKKIMAELQTQDNQEISDTELENIAGGIEELTKTVLTVMATTLTAAVTGIAVYKGLKSFTEGTFFHKK